MPDSLTALAILALVGLPGFVYLELRGGSPTSSGDTSTVDGTLAVLFFGLPCAIAGVLLSLTTQSGRFTAVLEAQRGDDAQVFTDALVAHAPLLAIVAFVGSLVAALVLAGVVRVVSACAPPYGQQKKRTSEQPTVGAQLGGAALLLVVALVLGGVTGTIAHQSDVGTEQAADASTS